MVLSDEFYREVLAHPVSCDLEAVRALAHAPAQLDLFLWLTWRCWTTKGKPAIPLFGALGLASQLGTAEYSRPRRFRENLERWLLVIRGLWPECPATISEDRDFLLIDHAVAINPVAI